jgi:hypothetical protein
MKCRNALVFHGRRLAEVRDLDNRDVTETDCAEPEVASVR